MKLVVRTGRGARAPWADAACADWGKRITRWFPFAEVEAERWKKSTRSRVIVFDERGEEASSEDVAGWIETAARDGITELVFAVGGPHGHAPGVREEAWKVIRLGRMVLAHAVARVVVVEQVYRACCIRAGTPYHHDG